MNINYTYDGQTIDEVMETHYLEMQAENKSHRELALELQWAYDELTEKMKYTKYLEDRVVSLSNHIWEVQ